MIYIRFLLTSYLVISTLFTTAQENAKLDNGILSLEKFDESLYNQLDTYLLDKRVIGLGEATHGTKEFFELKGKMIKYLVQNLDFKLIVFEAFFTDSESINHYILTGEGNPYKSIMEMGYYFYYIPEIYDLIEWLRDYNTDKKEDEKVKIYGCDMTAPQVTSRKVKDILLENDLLTQSISENLDWMIDRPFKRQYSNEEKVIIKELAGELNEAFDRLDKQDNLLQYYNQILQQSADYMLTKNGYLKANKRNKYMAENALFIQKYLEKNKKMIVWAHNAHIAKHSGHDKIIPMGKYLDNDLGESFYVIGFGFNRGGFLAKNNSTRITEDITVENADEGSSDFQFFQLHINTFFLDLSSFGSVSKENKWVLKKTKSRNIGAVYYPNELNRNYRKHIITESYDGLIFVEMTNPIKMLDFEKLK